VTLQARLALVLVYTAIPLLLLLSTLDDGTGERVATALLFVWSVGALYLLATSGGRDAYAKAFEHQHRTISSVPPSLATDDSTRSNRRHASPRWCRSDAR
jgi:hypothetical protein